LAEPGAAPQAAGDAGDELGLIFMCCHPALAQAVQVALTLRCVCGLGTAEIAAAFLVPEATMAKRLARARSKIRDTGIRLRMPDSEDITDRVSAVLRVVYLVFTEGHKASTGPPWSAATSATPRSGWLAASPRCCPASPRSPGCSRCCCSPTPAGPPGSTHPANWCCWPTRTAASGMPR
jgi:hypothetical protein